MIKKLAKIWLVWLFWFFSITHWANLTDAEIKKELLQVQNNFIQWIKLDYVLNWLYNYINNWWYYIKLFWEQNIWIKYKWYYDIESAIWNWENVSIKFDDFYIKTFSNWYYLSWYINLTLKGKYEWKIKIWIITEKKDNILRYKITDLKAEWNIKKYFEEYFKDWNVELNE